MPVEGSTWYTQFAALARQTASGGKLNGAKVGLIAAPFTVGPGLLLADLTEATFTGYAQVTVAAWSAPAIGPDGTPSVDGGDVVFTPSDAVTPNLIYGWFLVDSGGSNLLYAYQDDVPVPLDDALHSYTADVVYHYCI